MPFSNGHYDPETLAILDQAFNEALEQLMSASNTPRDKQVVRDTLAKRIMVAADDGERDLERLKFHALAAFPIAKRS
jgi:hypothetical protein